MPSIEVIVDRQLRRWELERSLRAAGEESRPELRVRPVLTVSRQRGSGGTIVAERVAAAFQYTLLHRDLIDYICASTGVGRRIAESLDEHAKPQVTSWLESVLGSKYIDTSDYLRALMRTIESIGRLGGVVVVGRGANFILGPGRGFHVRIVAPKELRVRRIVERESLSEKDAAREVETRDRERAEFVRRTFGRDVDDPQAYDLTINTGSLSIESAARLVSSAAMERFERDAAAQAEPGRTLEKT